MGSNGTRLLLLLLLLNVAGYASQTKKLIIYFGKDKDYITNAEAEKLQALKNADYVMLTGHTDNDGGDSFNMDLSKRRVDRVKAFIENISKDIKVETNYYGETQPVNQNANEEEKTMNRRVEIAYISNPLLSLDVPKNEYQVDNSKDQTIKCPHGTEVIIPAGAFNNRHVNITVSEYYNPDEIFAANLTTTSNNTPLETAGMIYITADANGVPIEPTKALEYKFPKQTKENGFKIFSGVRDSALSMNWVLNQTVESAIQGPDVSKNQRSLRAKQYDTSIIDVLDGDNILYEKSYTANWDEPDVQYFFRNIFGLVKSNIDTDLKKLAVDIAFNTKGEIISIKDNYRNNDPAAHQWFEKRLYACLPPQFKSNATGAKIHIALHKRVVLSGGYNGPISTSGWFICGNRDVNFNSPNYEGDAIVLSSTKLGWINCDRYLSGPKLQVYDVEADTNASVRLVLSKYKSFFGSESFTDSKSADMWVPIRRFVFYNIPDNEDVVLISTKKIEGIVYLAIEKAKTSANGSNVKFNYKPVSKTELAEAIRTLKI